MMEAYKDKDCEFIWLLDSDSLPCPGSLEALKKTWKKYNCKNKEKNLVLCSRRPKHEHIYIQELFGRISKKCLLWIFGEQYFKKLLKEIKY